MKPATLALLTLAASALSPFSGKTAQAADCTVGTNDVKHSKAGQLGLYIDGSLTHAFKNTRALIEEISRLEEYGVCTRAPVPCELVPTDDQGMSLRYLAPGAWLFANKTIFTTQDTDFATQVYHSLGNAGLCAPFPGK